MVNQDEAMHNRVLKEVSGLNRGQGGIYMVSHPKYVGVVWYPSFPRRTCHCRPQPVIPAG